MIPDYPLRPPPTWASSAATLAIMACAWARLMPLPCPGPAARAVGRCPLGGAYSLARVRARSWSSLAAESMAASAAASRVRSRHAWMSTPSSASAPDQSSQPLAMLSQSRQTAQ